MTDPSDCAFCVAPTTRRLPNGAAANCPLHGGPMPLPETTTIETERLRALFDMAVGSMNFTSGFLDTEEVEHLRAAAALLGVDPAKATPSEFESQYPHPFRLWRGWREGWPIPGCQATRCGKPVNDPIHRTHCDQCGGLAWVRIGGKVNGAVCGYETVTECQGCNPDKRIPWDGQVELHAEQPHHLAHQTPPSVVDPNCPACKEDQR